MKNKKEEKKETQKPAILVLRETKETIVQSLVASGLPDFVLRPMLEELCNQARQGEINEYNLTKEQYERDLKESEAKENAN